MIRRLFASASIAVVLLAAPASAHARTSDAPQAATSEFDRLVDDSKAAMMGDPEAALRHSSRALAVAGREGPGVHTATAQWLQGEALLRLNRAADAEPTIRQGLAVVAMRAPNTKLHGDLTRALGAVLATQGQVQPALQNFQAAFKIFGAAKEPRSQAMALQDIGSIYQDAGDYQKVLQYYAQSAELYKGDPSILVAAHNNVGQALKELKKYDEAITEFRKARTLAKEMESPYLEAWILDNLASTELLAGHIPAADKDLNDGLRISQADSGAHQWQPFLWGVAAQIAQKRGQPAQAALLIERTFAGKDVATTELPFREFHRTAYEVYSTLGDEHRALVHLKAYKRLDDEVRALAASTNAALMAAQFDFANQASRIAQLKAGQLQRDIALARTRNTVTGLLLLGSVFVTALMAVAFVWIRRSRNEVRAANGMLNVANEALEKALAARTEFLATTSHEIRTPLNGILGMTQVILRDPSLDPALRDKIAVVHGSGETMRALVDDILDVAKIETGKLEISRAEMNLAELFAEAAQLWTARASAKGLQLVLDVADAPETIVEDATRLRQVLFNLMSNAIK